MVKFFLIFISVFYSSIALASPKIEVLAKLQQRPGNPAVLPNGDVYFSMHPFDNPEFKIMKLEDSEAKPYPNEEISRNFISIIGIQATKDGRLWWLDMGNKDVSPKLVAWNTKENKLSKIYNIPSEASVANSFHQDFAIDEKRGKAFLADMSRGNLIDESNPAIVVIDLYTGETRRVLSGNEIFQPSENALIAEGKSMRIKDGEGKLHEIKLGLNPIAIDPQNEFVYFSTMTEGKIYRVAAAILGDFNKSEGEIEKVIEIYADKPSSDGIAVGENGEVYITNVDEGSIDIADETGTKVWAKDKSLIWPDGLYVAPDDSIVVTINQLNRAAIFNDGKSKAKKPYLVIRISD